MSPLRDSASAGKGRCNTDTLHDFDSLCKVVGRLYLELEHTKQTAFTAITDLQRKLQDESTIRIKTEATLERERSERWSLQTATGTSPASSPPASA